MFWTGEGGRAGISKNVTNFVTNAGSQLTWEGGRAGISKNVTNFVTDAGSQLTFLMFRFRSFFMIFPPLAAWTPSWRSSYNSSKRDNDANHSTVHSTSTN